MSHNAFPKNASNKNGELKGKWVLCWGWHQLEGGGYREGV
jgi:hypothetical protein